MPKIIIINRYCMPDQSATSRMVSSLALALPQPSYGPVLLASQMLHDRSGDLLPGRGTISGVTVQRLRTSRFGRAGLLGRAVDYLTFHGAVCLWLLRNLKAGDICVVCTDPPMLSVTALIPVMLRRGIMINWIMDLFPEAAIGLGVIQGGSAWARGLLWVRDWSLRHASLNVAPMPRMAAALERRGIPASQIRVIEHWSDGQAIRPLASEDSLLRTEWELGERFVVGYSGNLGRAHDFGTVLQAALRLRHDTQIVFLFIGDGHQRLWLEQEAARLGLSNILFKPLQPRERLAEALAVADVHLVSLMPHLEDCIIPSKFHGIAAAGRPVLFVGDPDGEIATLIRSGECGATVAIGDDVGLVRWITRLRSEKRTCQELGLNARRLFDMRFTESRGVGDWVRVLDESSTVQGTDMRGLEGVGVSDARGAQ